MQKMTIPLRKTYLGAAEDSGSECDFCLLLHSNTPEVSLSENPALVLTEFKIPDPLMPVLDPSSAAPCDKTDGGRLESLNLFDNDGCPNGTT